MDKDTDKYNKISSSALRKNSFSRIDAVNKVNITKDKVRALGSKISVLTILIILLSALIGGIVGGLISSRSNNGISSASLSGQKKVVTSTSELISQIAKNVGPSVVSINVEVTQSNSAVNSLFYFGPQGGTSTQRLAGTGIILSSEGVIITNRHVVPEGTSNVSVTLSNGVQLKNVSVIGRTSSSSSLDIAFLKINDTKGEKLTPAVLGNSAQTQVGDAVVAIGNALGQFQNTVTSGIISGFGRSITASSGSGGTLGSSEPAGSENLEDLFQTDAAINEGNSGGPLVNLNGQVIAINTAVAGNAQNIGFAIPINYVKGLINQVINTGKFSQPYLGVRYVTLTPDVASAYKVSVNSGALIDPNTDSVASGSPAATAGLKPGDIIVSINGKKVDQQNSLTGLLDQYNPGTKIKIGVYRDGKVSYLDAQLGSF